MIEDLLNNLLMVESWSKPVESSWIQFSHFVTCSWFFQHSANKGDLFSWCDGDPGPGRAREDAGRTEFMGENSGEMMREMMKAHEDQRNVNWFSERIIEIYWVILRYWIFRFPDFKFLNDWCIWDPAPTRKNLEKPPRCMRHDPPSLGMSLEQRKPLVAYDVV